jgi:hypothetical protein
MSGLGQVLLGSYVIKVDVTSIYPTLLRFLEIFPFSSHYPLFMILPPSGKVHIPMSCGVSSFRIDTVWSIRLDKNDFIY